MKNEFWVELVDSDGEVEVHDTATKAVEAVKENGFENYQEIWEVSVDEEQEISLDTLVVAAGQE